MKICILTHTFPRFQGDTAAPFMGSLAEGFSKLGHEVVVLTPYDTKIDKQRNIKYKVKTYKYAFFDRFHTLGYSRTLVGDKKLKLNTYLLSPLMLMLGFVALLKIVRSEKVDIISAHWIIPNGFIAALVFKILKTPFTVTIPGSDIYLGGKNKVFKKMVHVAANSARFVISDSAYYLTQLKSLDINVSKSAVIRYGVDTSKFIPTKKDNLILKKYELTDKTPIVLVVGRLVEKKGFMYLINAFPEILRKVPNAKLLIVGEGDQKQELEQKISELNIINSIIFVGTVSYDQLSKFYNLADVFVMPSIKDQSGNIDASPVAMMEAMACGTPIVATKFAGGEGLIVSQKTGFEVEEKNSRSLANAVVDLLQGNNKEVMKRQVRKIAEENFSNLATAKKYLNIFQEILKR